MKPIPNPSGILKKPPKTFKHSPKFFKTGPESFLDPSQTFQNLLKSLDILAISEWNIEKLKEIQFSNRVYWFLQAKPSRNLP